MFCEMLLFCNQHRASDRGRIDQVLKFHFLPSFVSVTLNPEPPPPPGKKAGVELVVVQPTTRRTLSAVLP